MTHIAKQNKTILDDHLKIRDEVRELNENIKNNMRKLYGDLKREETVAIVERLIEVPEDIANLSFSLASRQIPTELFPKIKKAYQSLSDPAAPGTLEVHKHLYRLLFFQHFSSLTLFDKDLQSEIEKDYSELMASSFKNDITKTSEEFLRKIIKESKVLDFREKLKRYFIALRNSQFANYLELHKHLYNVLATKENRFDFYSILQQEDPLKDTAKIYGQFLLSDYKNAAGNTEAQSKVLMDIVQATETKKDSGKSGPQVQ